MTGVPVEWRRENELPLLSAYYDSLIGAGKADPAVFVSTVLHEHPVPPMAPPTASVQSSKLTDVSRLACWWIATVLNRYRRRLGSFTASSSKQHCAGASTTLSTSEQMRKSRYAQAEPSLN